MQGPLRPEVLAQPADKLDAALGEALEPGDASECQTQLGFLRIGIISEGAVGGFRAFLDFLPMEEDLIDPPFSARSAAGKAPFLSSADRARSKAWTQPHSLNTIICTVPPR